MRSPVEKATSSWYVFLDPTYIHLQHHQRHVALCWLVLFETELQKEKHNSCINMISSWDLRSMFWDVATHVCVSAGCLNKVFSIFLHSSTTTLSGWANSFTSEASNMTTGDAETVYPMGIGHIKQRKTRCLNGRTGYMHYTNNVTQH